VDAVMAKGTNLTEPTDEKIGIKVWTMNVTASTKKVAGSLRASITFCQDAPFL